MFSVGDYVQPRKGGPKLKVLEVNGDSVVAVQPAMSKARNLP